MLIDDIVTTGGNTMREAAQRFYAAGAMSVGVLATNALSRPGALTAPPVTPWSGIGEPD